jgi:dienelactone hydrolase
VLGAEPSTRLERHLAAVRDATLPALRFDLAGLPYGEWRRALRSRLAATLGLPAGWDGGAHRLRQVEEGAWQETPTFRWRRVLLRSEAELDVPALLVLPPEAAIAEAGRLPVTIACQGHSTDGMRVSLGMVAPETYERSIVNGDRDFALQAVRHGFACLALEMRGFGELRLPADRERNANNSCAALTSLGNQVGRPPIRGRVWDVMAAVDYLSALPLIDPSRIVLTGNSGGGTVTLYAGALESRLAALVPSSAFCTFADSIQAVSHCACNYVPGMSALCDMSDLAGLGAPRPQLIVNGVDDPIFPIAGVRTAFARAEAIYAAAGAPQALRLFTGGGGHRYYAEPVWPWLADALSLPQAWGRARYEAAPPPAAT